MNKRLRLFVVAIAALALILGAIVAAGVSKARAKKEMEERLELVQRAAAVGAAGRASCERIVGPLEQDLAALETDEGGSDRVKKAYRALGDCQMQLGRHQQAVDAYAKVAFFDPQQGRAHGDLANAYTRLGDQSNAIRHARLAAQLSPNTWQAHRVLARALENAGRFPDALAAMRRAAELAPANQQGAARQAVTRLESKVADAAPAAAAQRGSDE
ncbi:MAG: hypothetical protein IT532_10185 [Burkholderiales bacterium]|nr:hypothetical protein [Burkholderiales bacterium]